VPDHLAAYRRAKDITEDDTFRPMPEGSEYLFSAWEELHRARSSGMATNPISWQDIDAYGRVIDPPLVPWEARAVRAIDDAYLTAIAPDDGDGGN
jgi:hypothetical protein